VLYLTIRTGRSAATAEPILATSDIEIIGLVGREIARKLGADHVPPQVLQVAGLEARGEHARRAGSSATTLANDGTLRGRFGTPRRRRICAREGCGKVFTLPTRRRGNEKLYCSRRCCRLASRTRREQGRAVEPAPFKGTKLSGRRGRLIAVAPDVHGESRRTP